MCPNEIIQRLLDILHNAIPHIHDEATLKNVVETLEDISVRIMRDGVDK